MQLYKVKKENNIFSYDGKPLKDETTIADPTYDLTFKKLFSQTKDWDKNIISLLNSLIFTDEIKEIKLLNNEFINRNEEHNKNVEYLEELRSDLSFECTFKSSKKKEKIINLINIEMQLGCHESFLERLFVYGSSSKIANWKRKVESTTVIGFINLKEKLGMNSAFYSLGEFNLENSDYIKRVDKFLDIYIINLNQISEKLINDEKIIINGKEISPIGKNWLKLLSVRHWGKPNNKYYFDIPKLNFDNTLNSAINFLKSITQGSEPIKDLNEIYDKEEEYWKKIKNYLREIEGENISKRVEEIAKKKVEELPDEKLQELAKKRLEKLAEEKANELANIKAEKLAEEKANELANIKAEEFAEEKDKLLKDEKIKFFINTYKNFDFKIEEFERKNDMDLSNLDEKKIYDLWGEDEPKKLENLKNYIGQKRKKRK